MPCPEPGSSDYKRTERSLAPLIDEVVGTACQLAQQNKNRLVVEVQENLGAIIIDPMQLRQNLLSNACKFTKEGDKKVPAPFVTRDLPSNTPRSVLIVAL